MPTLAQNPTGKRYTRKLGLCDCGLPAVKLKSGNPVCARCHRIEVWLYPRKDDARFTSLAFTRR